MIYAWIHKGTETIIEVERPMKDSSVPPTKEELVAKGLEHLVGELFVKYILGGSFSRGFGQKGYWH
jgi:hypothetical protein